MANNNEKKPDKKNRETNISANEDKFEEMLNKGICEDNYVGSFIVNSDGKIESPDLYFTRCKRMENLNNIKIGKIQPVSWSKNKNNRYIKKVD